LKDFCCYCLMLMELLS